MKIRVGTRRSALAVAQTEQVIAALKGHWPGLEVEVVRITTRGDVQLDLPLHEVGGKGLFVKEIEEAMLAGEIDLAVHSAKDLPAETPPGLAIVCYPLRVDPRDAVISRDGRGLRELPPGAMIGTSSLRRIFLLRHLRGDLKIEPLRGNVDTRLRRVREGNFDAIVLASAGLIRLGLAGAITEQLDPDSFIPAVGQGCLGIEARVGDERVVELARALNDPETERAVTAERAFLARIEGGCQVPAGGHARLRDGRLEMRGFLALPDGSFFGTAMAAGAPGEVEAIGRAVADDLLARSRAGERGTSR